MISIDIWATIRFKKRDLKMLNTIKAKLSCPLNNSKHTCEKINLDVQILRGNLVCYQKSRMSSGEHSRQYKRRKKQRIIVLRFMALTLSWTRICNHGSLRSIWVLLVKREQPGWPKCSIIVVLIYFHILSRKYFPNIQLKFGTMRGKKSVSML